MEIIKRGTNIDFVGKRQIALFFSLALIAITIASLIYKKGPNYGIDFAGGTQVIVKFSEDPSSAGLRESLEASQLGDLVVQFLRSMHDGILSTYLSWAVIGLGVLAFILMFRW